ncbi:MULTISPECIES: DnaJ C-terminal domain-containing protein [unclassified Brevibacterium]|uniref:DnaJ C-terminal domain-containing protein n=1 Tax=unclassified Brevibacterium TaxID=2614124 RepID=UPI001E503A08|nr:MULTISPECIES: DnaJ C-terminal domain-containing protein [unclassified Brevibacterium]MCD1286563.1 molecular chaperone DnaJ [Brevibacterium sp. CCUG 69071]MDK8434206.1 DnaJ C-terminal domain-containing protein [Brevibacterium sp. H-BE7]
MNTGPQNDWFDKDFYKTLGVSKDASDAEIKKAYRKLARKYHPDANPGDAKAEDKFKEIGQAHQVLSDKESRAQYDQVRAMGGGARFSAGAGGPGGASGGGFDDVFSDLFGGGGRTRTRATYGGGGGGDVPPDLADLLNGFGGGAGYGGGYGSGGYGGYSPPVKGGDIKSKTTLSFTEAINGASVKLNMPSGKPLTVRTPIGVKDGQKIRLAGKGKASPNGGEAGDVILTVNVKPHPVFTRDGDNLRMELPVSFDEAALGAEVKVPTLGGMPVKVKVAPGTPSGRTLRVRGKGVTTKKGTGDLLVTVEIVAPQNLSKDAKEAVESFKAATADEDPRAGLLDKAKAN